MEIWPPFFEPPNTQKHRSFDFTRRASRRATLIASERARAGELFMQTRNHRTS